MNLPASTSSLASPTAASGSSWGTLATSAMKRPVLMHLEMNAWIQNEIRVRGRRRLGKRQEFLKSRRATQGRRANAKRASPIRAMRSK